jgi:hypothetical protein
MRSIHTFHRSALALAMALAALASSAHAQNGSAGTGPGYVAGTAQGGVWKSSGASPVGEAAAPRATASTGALPAAPRAAASSSGKADAVLDVITGTGSGGGPHVK